MKEHLYTFFSKTREKHIIMKQRNFLLPSKCAAALPSSEQQSWMFVLAATVPPNWVTYDGSLSVLERLRTSCDPRRDPQSPSGASL